MKRKIRKRKKEYCSRPLVPKIRWQRLLRASDESIKCQPDVPGQPGQFYWKTTGQSGGSTPCLAFVSVLFQIQWQMQCPYHVSILIFTLYDCFLQFFYPHIIKASSVSMPLSPTKQFSYALEKTFFLSIVKGPHLILSNFFVIFTFFESLFLLYTRCAVCEPQP